MFNWLKLLFNRKPKGDTLEVRCKEIIQRDREGNVTGDFTKDPKYPYKTDEGKKDDPKR